MMNPKATEQHYTIQQVADMWGVSTATVRRLFEDAPGVLKISMPRLLKNHRKPKPHALLRIPAFSRLWYTVLVHDFYETTSLVF